MSETRKRISELPEAQSFEGLYTIGVDNAGRSVKVGIGDILDECQQAAEDIVAPVGEERSAREAADAQLGARMDAMEAAVDDTPTPSSENMVRSGGIYTYGEGIREEIGTVEDNPEWVRVIKDFSGKVLCGIRADGTVEWGAGVPTPVKEHINQQIDLLRNGSGEGILDGLDEVVYFLHDVGHLFKGKKVSVLGDSISTWDGEGYKIDGYLMWYPHQGDRSSDVAVVTDTWWRQLIDNAGGELDVNASYSGSTASSHSVGFAPRVPLLGSPDVVLVELGSNDSANNVAIGSLDFDADSYDLSLFAPAYIHGMKELRKYYPNAIVVCLAFDMGIAYQQAIEAIANHFGAMYVYVGDITDVHPNKAEMKAASGKIFSTTLTLGSILDHKADSVPGKGVIDKEFAEGVSHTNSNEYVSVETDAEGRVLSAVYADGSRYVHEITSESLDRKQDLVEIENPEFINVEVDAEGRVLSGTRLDGTHYISNIEIEGYENLQEVVSDLGEIHETVNDPENRTALTLDVEGREIGRREEDGTLVENIGIKTKELTADIVNAKELKGLTSEGVSELEKLLKEHGFSSSALDWSDYDTLDGEKPLHLPMPQCGVVNLMTDYDLTRLSKEGYRATSHYPAGVKGETYDIPVQMQFWDMQGNYFKKHCLIGGQGNSSMAMPKKNIALDLFDTDEMDGAFTIQFGDWVAQDSFHLKAYYTDAFRCVSPVTYQLYDEMVRTRGVFDDYFWKRALIDFDSITTTSNGAADEDDNLLKLENEARGFPKGFPILVFQNGVFYGVFAWLLKKHRKNYHQEKDNVNQIQLDGTIDENTLFNANGDSSLISWIPGNDNGFEVRNPKGKDYYVTAEGGKYTDYATTSQELAGVSVLGETVATYGSSITYAQGDKCVVDGRMYLSRADGNRGNNPSLSSYGKKPKDVWKKATEWWVEITFTDSVKKKILTLSTYMPQLRTADAAYEASEKTDADKNAFKTVFETMVDPANLIDYMIVADTVGGISASKNWQWCTYDGRKWYVGLYDCDNALAQQSSVTETRRPTYSTHRITTMFCTYILKYYQAELEAQWKLLRDRGIISVEHIVEKVKAWMNAVGSHYYEKEIERWPSSTHQDSLYRLTKWLSVVIGNMDRLYNYN